MPLGVNICILRKSLSILFDTKTSFFYLNFESWPNSWGVCCIASASHWVSGRVSSSPKPIIDLYIYRAQKKGSIFLSVCSHVIFAPKIEKVNLVFDWPISQSILIILCRVKRVEKWKSRLGDEVTYHMLKRQKRIKKKKNGFSVEWGCVRQC